MKRGRSVVRVPIAQIKVLSSRERNQDRFKELIQSIEAIGLKRPITISQRREPGTYDLICGERRMDAFAALGEAEVPALLVDAAAEDCILMGLIENIARRRHTPKELLQDIGRLSKHYRASEISVKLGLGVDKVRAIILLLRRAEDRLLSAVDRGVVPSTLAVEIAKAATPKLQGALLEAHLNEHHTAKQIRAMRKLVEQRQRSTLKAQGSSGDLSSADLVRAYRLEADREQLIRKKADLAHARLTVLVSALKTLVSERMFANIIRREGLEQIPLQLLHRLSSAAARQS
jgi:ParB family chromosome partitioning protein